MKRKVMMVLMLVLTCSLQAGDKVSLDKWNYIQVDESRAKWGDWQEPEWLRYFGLDFSDVNRDGYVDIVSGRYFYRNPGACMAKAWTRIDLGFNVDGMLFVDVDGDDYADVIASALPDVLWLEAEDFHGNAWKAMKIGTLPKTGHNNGQGYRAADLIPGGKTEIILQADLGIYACSIPDKPIPANWDWIMIAESGSDEGIGVGDVDGDGDLDIVFGDILEGEKEHPTLLNWAENPGELKTDWARYQVGETDHAIDRVEVGDLNGDGRTDLAVSIERWPGKEPDAALFWFEAPADPKAKGWKRHEVVRQYSMNNLDIGDIDLDGDIDLVTNEHKGEALTTQVWENNGTGNFTKHLVDSGKEMHLGAQLVDLDSDGDLDIVGHAWDSYQFLHVWRNDGIQEEIKWKHLSTTRDELPIPNGGDQQTSSIAADFDGDGAAEFMITDRAQAPAVVIYDYKDGQWQKAVVDEDHLNIEAGATTSDVDGDGDLDVVFGGDYAANQVWWWENPLPKKSILRVWKRYTVKNSGANKHHDQMFVDCDGDGRDELVFWSQSATSLILAEIPKNPKKAKEWPMQVIYSYTEDSEMMQTGQAGYPGWKATNEHEGLAKGDIDGDGVDDIIGGGLWFQYKEGKYLAHLIDESYTFTRSAVGQFIEGGRPEVILIAGDGLAPMYLYEWREGTWFRKMIIDEVDNGHTIDVVDFNGDGHADIFNAEMRFGENNPDAEIRILLGDGKGNFRKHVVATGIACHEGRIADLDGDGDYDILSKPYNWNSPRVDLFINESQ